MPPYQSDNDIYTCGIFHINLEASFHRRKFVEISLGLFRFRTPSDFVRIRDRNAWKSTKDRDGKAGKREGKTRCEREHNQSKTEWPAEESNGQQILRRPLSESFPLTRG